MSAHDRRALAMLGAAVRIGRHRMGLTQRALADMSGVSQTAISRLERGLVWGMTIVRLAQVAWVLEERTPFGGCPHPHRCSYGGRWRQLMLEHVAMAPDEESQLHALGLRLSDPRPTYDIRLDADRPDEVDMRAR